MTTYPIPPSDPGALDAIPDATIAALLDTLRLMANDLAVLQAGPPMATKLTAPGSLSVTAGTQAAVPSVTYADPNTVPASIYTVAVSCLNGSVSITVGGSLAAGSGTKTISAGFTLANAQSALAALLYSASAAGSDTITITVTRAGLTTSAAAIVATASVAVTVAAAASAPTAATQFVMPTAITSPQNTTTQIRSGYLYSTAAAAAPTTMYLLTATTQTGGGNVAMALGGCTVYNGGSGTTLLTLQGTWAQVQAAFLTLTYQSGTATSDVLHVTLYTAAAAVIVAANTAAITITAGATYAETGGYSGGTLGTTFVMPSTITIAQNVTNQLQSGYLWSTAAAAAPTAAYRLGVATNGYCGYINFALGGCTVTAGTNNSTYVVIQGTWPQIRAAFASMTYQSFTNTPDAVNLTFYDGAGVRIVDANSSTAVTVNTVAGATYAESGGWTGGVAATATATKAGTIALPATNGGLGFDNTKAYRIADMMETFGVNTFSMAQYPGAGTQASTNFFGSNGNYTSTAVSAMMNWLTNSSGMIMLGREYNKGTAATLNADGSVNNTNNQYVTTNQKTWIPAVVAATGTKFTVCAANADYSGVVQLIADSAKQTTPYISYGEGINEPNYYDGTSNKASVAQTIAAQQAIYSACQSAGIPCVGTSFITGDSYSEGYASGYADGDNPYHSTVAHPNLATLNANTDIGNVHYYSVYMQDIDDGVSRKGELGDLVQGGRVIYPNKPLFFTELNPVFDDNLASAADSTLLAAYKANKLGFQAYYIGLYMLSAFCNWNVAGNFWWALCQYTYNSDPGLVGLFQIDVTSPTPAAYVIRAMYSLTGDTGTAKRSFTPATLAYTTTGLTALTQPDFTKAPFNSTSTSSSAPFPAGIGPSPYMGGHTALFQNSAGTYFLFVWNGQLTPGGTAASVTINLPSAATKIVEFNITGNPTASNTNAVQTVTSAASITIALKNEIHLLQITMPGAVAAGVKTDASGTTAMRAADLMNTFGVNIFPLSAQDGGDYSTTGFASSINYITGGSGHSMIGRVYCDGTNPTTSGAAPEQSFMATAYTNTGMRVAPCIYHNPTHNSAATAIALANAAYTGGYLAYCEGSNEPDNTSQFGVLAAADCLTLQQALYNGVSTRNIKVAAASCEYDATYQSNYYGSTLTSQVAASDYSTSHLYPNSGPWNGGNQGYNYTVGIQGIWNSKPTVCTEYHPSMYNNSTVKADSERYCAYHTPMGLLSGVFNMNLKALIWFCMYDYPNTSGGYAFGIPAGLFASNSGNPRLVATVMKAMYAAAADTGGTKQTFTPGKLNYTIAGLPVAISGTNVSATYGGGQSALCQCSDGSFLLFIWNEQQVLSAATDAGANITVTFGSAMTSVKDIVIYRPANNNYNGGTAPAPGTVAQTLSSVSSVAMNMLTELRVLKIVHP